MPTSILITGGNGNLAKIINKHLLSEFEIVCITRKDFDLLNLNELTNYLSGKKFDVLIHTAISGGRRTKRCTHFSASGDRRRGQPQLRHRSRPLGRGAHGGCGAGSTSA